MLILLLILVILAVTGVLWFVVKVAFAVALGLFIALVAAGAFFAWRLRAAVRRVLNPPRPSRGRVRGSSEVTVLRPDDEPPR